MDSISTALLKLIELETNNVSNPCVCGSKEIFNSKNNKLDINSSETECQIIIPRYGDLIQSLEIESTYEIHCAFIILDIMDNDRKIKYNLNILKKEGHYILVCDYEINLLRPYQVAKLILSFSLPLTLNSKSMTTFDECRDREFNVKSVASPVIQKINANYIFLGIDARRQLFRQ